MLSSFQKIENLKSEFRNPKQIQKRSNDQNLRSLKFFISEIQVRFEFRLPARSPALQDEGRDFVLRIYI